MNGLDRALAMAERNGWTLKTTSPHVGYQRQVTWHRGGDQRVTAYKTVRGAITGGNRSWGEVRIVGRAGAADAVVAWLAEPVQTAAEPTEEPTPDKTTDRAVEADVVALKGAGVPVIRPAIPSTPDRKLRRLLEELEDDSRRLREDFQSALRGATFDVSSLEELADRLGRLRSDAQYAKEEAMYLMVERASSKETADVLRKLQAEGGRS